MITIVDSGIANIGSVCSAFDRIGVQTEVVCDPAAINLAGALILPGVGSFTDGMDSLRRNGLDAPICQAGQAGIPILGICLGMQLLAELSEEFGEHQGLGLIAGRVVPLVPAKPGERVPNIGWCKVNNKEESRLFRGIDSGAFFYFMHSFFLKCTHPGDMAGDIFFGCSSACVAVERGNLFGVQFHPEKSQDPGLQLLHNFVQLAYGKR